MSTLILTVGLPRSGKSTWALAQGFPVVSPDAIRLALHGQRFIAQAEPFVWLHARLMVRSLFNAGHKVVILDATNTTRACRDEWRGDEWEVAVKFIPEAVETCRTRAAMSGLPELFPVIDRMAAGFEPPAEDEARWEG